MHASSDGCCLLTSCFYLGFPTPRDMRSAQCCLIPPLQLQDLPDVITAHLAPLYGGPPVARHCLGLLIFLQATCKAILKSGQWDHCSLLQSAQSFCLQLEIATAALLMPSAVVSVSKDTY